MSSRFGNNMAFAKIGCTEKLARTNRLVAFLKADRLRILALFIPSSTCRTAILGSRGRGVQPTTERECKSI